MILHHCLLATLTIAMYNQVSGIKLTTTNMYSDRCWLLKKCLSKQSPILFTNTSFWIDKYREFLQTRKHQLAVLYKIFASISIFLSCLGLYGLASFMAVQRIKEVWGT